jgi:tetratricopeptide (TPR) repeat protein
LLEQGSAASEDALLRALQAAAQAPESLSAAVALDETLAASDDPESRAVAIFGRMPYASTEVSRSLRSARARALLGAGRTREAADAARRALAQNPDDLGALDLLRVAARTLGDFATVADAAQRLAQHAQGRSRAQLLEEAALVLEREFGQHAEAERCLQAALEQDPTSELAFARLHDLLLERRDTDALLTLLARRADKSEDAGARAELCYEQALILRAAGRKSETVAVLERVLADDAEHSAALGLLVETCTALEHWEATVAALRRLALANVPDEQKRLARLGAAEFLERKLGDVEGALRELELLRSAGIRDRDVLARIGGLRERLQRYRPAVEAYREAAAQSTLAARAELERRAGDVLRDHLSASNEAIAAYGRALEAYALDDVACGSLLELSEDVELRGRVLSDFERELRSAIEREPARPELLRILRRLGSWRARRDLELVALSALHALGAVDAHERKDLEALRDAARRKTQIALSDAALARLSDLVGQAELARAAQLVSQALAAQDQAPTGAVQLDDRTRAEAAEQRLELGRNAMASRLGVLPLLARTRAARREALRAGLGLGGAGSGSPEFEALSKQIGKRLARAQRKELARLAAQLTRPEVQLDAYLDLLELCLARAGLLLADDLGVALAQVAAAGGAGAELETFAGAPRALDLLRFWLSPRLLELRRELGWGP